MNVTAIILARGGSKSVPGKNIKELGGKPLLSYTVQAALDAEFVDRVVVSTDNDQIAAVARESGAEVPFMRPAHDASDSATSEESLQYALQQLSSAGTEVDILVYLQVDCPFRRPGMIDRCVKKLLDDPSLDSAFVAYPTHKKYWIERDGVLERLPKDRSSHSPRQKDKIKVFREDTGIACATRPRIIDQGRRLGDNVWIEENPDLLSAFDIDTSQDFELAEVIVRQLGPNNPYYF